MSTGQKYSGKGDSTTSLEQTAQFTPPATRLPNQDAHIDPHVYQAQTRLLELADSFVAIGFTEGPIQAVDRLLTHWMSTSVEELSAANNKDQLHCILLLIDFLGELYQASLSGGEGGVHA